VQLEAQVPFDTAGVPVLKEIRRWDIPTVIRRNINTVSSLCGVDGNDVVISRIHEVGPQTWSQLAPFDTVNIYSWPTGPETSSAIEIDYDGIPPFEYFTENWEVFRCGGGRYPTNRIDTLDCLPTPFTPSTHYVCEIDGNGQNDIVIYPRDASVNYADVVLSGVEYGNGCNRVISLPRKPGNNGLVHTTTWVKFYRDYDGILRMLINRTPVNPKIGGIYLYEVQVNRDGQGWKVDYVVTDSIVRDIDPELAPYAVYPECIVNDSINRHHYTVQSWTRGYRYGKDVLNEPVISVYLIDKGRLIETEAVIGVVSSVYSHDNAFDEGSPLISLAFMDYWKYFCRITEISKPIAKFQWIISAPYRAFIYDQTDDGKRDFLIASDHLPGQLRLYDMSILTTSVEEHIDLRSMKSSVIDESNTLAAYPNPAADELIVIWNDHHDDKDMYNTGTLTLRNHIGSVVATTSISKNERVILETSHFASGQYLLQVQTSTSASVSSRTVVIVQ